MSDIHSHNFADLSDEVLAVKFPGATIVRVDQMKGSDAHTGGKSWKKPYYTLQAALNFARYELGTTSLSYTDKNRNFVVLVKPGHYNEGEILFSGYNIRLIGCGPLVPGKDYGVSINYDGAADATAAIAFSGSGISLENLHIYCDFAAPAIYCAGGDNNAIKNCVIECDGTLATYGIHMASMKGSRIEGNVIQGAKTAGIWVDGGADHYFINGWIENNTIHSNVENTTGILVDVDNTCYNSWIRRNWISLTNGSSCKGIDINTTAGGPLAADNYVSVPSSATPIEHAGGEQFWLGNHTAAGTTNADPAPAAGA